MIDQTLPSECLLEAEAWETVIRELGTILKVSQRSFYHSSDPLTTSADDALYSTYGDDPELSDLVRLFVAEMPERIRNLESLFQNADDERLARAAHQMKGAVGGYGFHAISPAAAALEAAVRNGDSGEAVRQALDELIGLCQRARAGRRSANCEIA